MLIVGCANIMTLDYEPGNSQGREVQSISGMKRQDRVVCGTRSRAESRHERTCFFSRSPAPFTEACEGIGHSDIRWRSPARADFGVSRILVIGRRNKRSFDRGRVACDPVIELFTWGVSQFSMDPTCSLKAAFSFGRD